MSARARIDQAQSAIERGDYSYAVKRLFNAWDEGGKPYAKEIHDLAAVAKEHTTGKRQTECDLLVQWTRLALASPQSGDRIPTSASELVQPDGSIKCAKCGSTQFTTKRSTARKVMFGVGSLLASANEVQCVACGTKYDRR
jgi:hypothetical protein